MTASARRWKVGELAQVTGLTIRTLHHWDETGLVSPRRTMAGHRIYTGADVTRLYQVLALRQMGLGLGQAAGDVGLHPTHTPEPMTAVNRLRGNPR